MMRWANNEKVQS